jgi:hypothetical protein
MKQLMKNHKLHKPDRDQVLVQKWVDRDAIGRMLIGTQMQGPAGNETTGTPTIGNKNFIKLGVMGEVFLKHLFKERLKVVILALTAKSQLLAAGRQIFGSDAGFPKFSKGLSLLG